MARSLLLAVGLLGAAQVHALGEAFKVCLEADAPPLSGDAGGFNVAVARAVAEWLGKPLHPVWFAAEDDDDSATARQVNALLQSGGCQLAAGFPLVRDALQPPPGASYRLSDRDGAGKRVVLARLIHSQPYYGVRFALAGRGADTPHEGVKSIDSMAALAAYLTDRDLRVLVEQNSLAHNLLLAWQGGALAGRVVDLSPNEGALLGQLVAGRADLALLEGYRLDQALGASPPLPVHRLGYPHPLTINLGFVAAQGGGNQLDAAMEALDDLLESGEIERLARESGLDYLPPGEPEVLPDLGLGALR